MTRLIYIAAFMATLLIALWLDHNAEENPVVLGAVYNLSGDQSGLDVSSAQGVQMAVDEINTGGGVLDRTVQLVLKDGQTDTIVIAAGTRALLDEHVEMPVIIGISDTDMVLAAAPVTAAQQHAFITSGATSPKLPEEVPGYLFLACFADNVQAAAGAEWAYATLPAKTVAVIYDDNMSYTRLLQQYFQTRFTQLGGSVKSVHKFDKAKPLPAIETLQQAELIYAATGPEDALAIVKMLRQAGFDGPVLGGDSFDAQALWQTQPDIDRVFFTTHVYLGSDNPNPRVQKFITDYRQRYPDSALDAFAALGYDTAMLALTAIARAGDTAPEKVRDALAKIRDFPGITGTISYQTNSAIPTKSVSIVGVDKGKLVWRTDILPAVVPEP